MKAVLSKKNQRAGSTCAWLSIFKTIGVTCRCQPSCMDSSMVFCHPFLFGFADHLMSVGFHLHPQTLTLLGKLECPFTFV